MPEIDMDLVNRGLAEIKLIVDELKEILDMGLEKPLSDLYVRDAAKYRLLVAIKAAISICNHIAVRGDEVISAYLHVSFGEAHFRDIDVAVFVDEDKVKDFIQYGVELSVEIERSVKLPVDVKVLNSAPLSFKYRAIRGELLLSRDDELRFRFMEKVIREYLDFKPVEQRMIREILNM